MSALKRDISVTEETKIALLEQSMLNINQSLSRNEIRIEKSEKDLSLKFDKVEQRFDKIDHKLERIQENINYQFRWVMGAIISLFSGLYATFIGGIIAKMFGFI